MEMPLLRVPTYCPLKTAMMKQPIPDLLGVPLISKRDWTSSCEKHLVLKQSSTHLTQISNFIVVQSLNISVIDGSSARFADKLLKRYRIEDAEVAKKASQKLAEVEYRVYHNNI
ncbi:hypothetical protein ACHAP7_007116 [Fusarium lateritium]